MAKAIGNVVLFVLNLLYGGFVFSLVWDLVIASQFNLPEITIMQALGIRLVSAYTLFGINYNIVKDKAKSNFSEVISVALVAETLFLAFAYIISLFI